MSPLTSPDSDTNTSANTRLSHPKDRRLGIRNNNSMNESNNDEIPKQFTRPVGEDFWSRYQKAVKKRKTAPRTLLEEQVEPYLKYIVWDEKTFEHDMTAFWVAVNRHHRTHPSGSTIRLLEWVARMNRLHPLQVVKVLHKPNKSWTGKTK